MRFIKLANRQLYSNQQTKDWVLFLVRIICMMLFLFSGYEKLITHDQFLRGLEKVAIVGRYAWAVSWLVPALELVISGLLAFERTVKIGLYAFIYLMIAFTIYIIAVLSWAETLPCHCNILVKSLSWPQHIAFNLVFVLLAFVGLRFQRKK